MAQEAPGEEVAAEVAVGAVGAAEVVRDFLSLS